MHKQSVFRANQYTSHYPDHLLRHVGIFSILRALLNLFLTPRGDLDRISNVWVGDLMNLTTFLKHIGNDNSGATAVEYGLIVSLIVIAMVSALNGVANETIEMWSYVSSTGEEAMTRN